MARYIDANALMGKYEEFILKNSGKFYITQTAIPLLDILATIETFPTADVEEVRRSEWILHNDGSGTCKMCNTRQKLIWDWDGWQHYCGHCGADMREG